MRERIVAAAAVLLAACGTAAAQEPTAVRRLTLSEAQGLALEASHRLAEARAREEASRAATAAREAAQRPIVSAIAGYTRTNHVTEFVVPSPTGEPRVLYPDVPDNYRTRLDLQWPIYTGGRSDALERAARAEASAAGADVEIARADLRLEVARSYWAVVTGNASVNVLEQGVARARAHIADVRARFDAGLVPPNEVASAEAQESRQRQLLIEARSQRDVALAEFNRLVGSAPGAMGEPASLLDDGVATGVPQDVAVARARDQRQERVALSHRIEAATEQRNAASAGRLPVVSIAGGVDYARPNPRIFPRTDAWEHSWDIGANVSWSLWDGGRVSADVAQATAGVESLRRRLAEFDSVLDVEIRQRRLEIESGLAAIAAAADAIRAASEARRVVNERYQAGVITQIEVLDADYALLQAELDRTRALANVRLAEARLARALGQ
jgi:outer membrane protein TolC